MKITNLRNIEQLDLHSDVIACTTSMSGTNSDVNNPEIILPTQTHTTNVAWVCNNISSYPETDALITMRTDIAFLTNLSTWQYHTELPYTSTLRNIGTLTISQRMYHLYSSFLNFINSS